MLKNSIILILIFIICKTEINLCCSGFDGQSFIGCKEATGAISIINGNCWDSSLCNCDLSWLK